MQSKKISSPHLQILLRVAVLAAMDVLLMNYLGIHTQYFKIGFSFVPIALCGMLYGAKWSTACAGLGDLINCLLGPYGCNIPVGGQPAAEHLVPFPAVFHTLFGVDDHPCAASTADVADSDYCTAPDWFQAAGDSTGRHGSLKRSALPARLHRQGGAPAFFDERKHSQFIQKRNTNWSPLPAGAVVCYRCA